MIEFITKSPLWVQTFWILILPTVLFMIGPLLVRRYVALESLATNNEVAGFKFATVGVLYAVLLAFSIIVVWEKFNDAEATVDAGAPIGYGHCLLPFVGDLSGRREGASIRL